MDEDVPVSGRNVRRLVLGVAFGWWLHCSLGLKFEFRARVEEACYCVLDCTDSFQLAEASLLWISTPASSQ